jgi:hypothetical protein
MSHQCRRSGPPATKSRMKSEGKALFENISRDVPVLSEKCQRNVLSNLDFEIFVLKFAKIVPVYFAIFQTSTGTSAISGISFRNRQF